jgi:transposase
LVYLDECGFSPSQSVNYSWTAHGRRKCLPYENPCRRRVNAIAALIPYGHEPGLLWRTEPHSLTSQDLLGMLETLPRQQGRLVVVLDNGSIHVSGTIKNALPALQRQGIELYYLPPYSPELNLIESVFGGIKAHGLPDRSYSTVPALTQAVHVAFSEAHARLLNRCDPLHHLRLAA